MCAQLSAQSFSKKNRNYTVLAESSTAALMNINGIAMWVNDDGSMEKNIAENTAGVTFPRGTSTLVYDGGLIWGGLVRDGATPALRVGGQAKVSGTIPGAIRTIKLPENRYDPLVRVFRIRKDWKTADLRQDAAETFGISIYDVTDDQIQELRNRYATDWLQWPWQKGAPYYDRNGIPGYQPDTSGSLTSTKDEPGLLGADEVIWLVCNDLSSSATSGFAGSPPVGLEEQITCWGYAQRGILGNVIFQKHKIIYKGTASTPPSSRIDSMFIAKWADTDIGDATDDYSGCDIAKNMGFSYNATDFDNEYNKFGLHPPVVGYSLLQGPRVASVGDSAHWNSSTVPGYANLPMTSFIALVDSQQKDQPLRGTYTGTSEWWNILRGFRTTPLNPPDCYKDPFTLRCTTYPLSGDPVTYQGWVDGRVYPKGDRRIIISSGPFQMAVGDTQEVVFALMAAEGNTRTELFRRLDSLDIAAQGDFDNNFQSPAPIPHPNVRIVELDKTLILDWETDTLTTHADETYSSLGYKFETYKIYQYQSTSPTSLSVELPAFDPGAPRSLHLTTDVLRNKPFANGQRYYFAVTAVMYNPDASEGNRRIESDVHILTAIPHSPNPGVVYPYDIGDTVTTIKNIVGYSDAPVKVSYYDPSKASGDSLIILFHYTNTYQKPFWDLINFRTADTLLYRMATASGPHRVISEGLSVQVDLQSDGLKHIIQTKFNGQKTNDPIFGVPNKEGNYMILAGSPYMDSLNGSSVSDKDIELRFLGDSSWALLRRETPATSKWIRVPYTAWQMDRGDTSSTGRQIYTVITGQGQDSIWRPSIQLDQSYNGKPINVFYPISALVETVHTSNPTRYFGDKYYDDITNPIVLGVQVILWSRSSSNDAALGLYQAFVADLDNDGAPAPLGTVVRFQHYKRTYDGNKKLILPMAVQQHNIQAVRTSLDKITVFPNPYYGVNRAETNPSDRFVTFSHLPYYAKIRIYNLAGVLVKTVAKSSEDQYCTWGLTNENNLPVASGLYVAELELRDSSNMDLGTKELKLMIVQQDRVILTR